MIRQAHTYLAGAVSGTALIAVAVVVFVLLVSLQALRDWPLAGLGRRRRQRRDSAGPPAGAGGRERRRAPATRRGAAGAKARRRDGPVAAAATVVAGRRRRRRPPRDRDRRQAGGGRRPRRRLRPDSRLRVRRSAPSGGSESGGRRWRGGASGGGRRPAKRPPAPCTGAGAERSRLRGRRGDRRRGRRHAASARVAEETVNGVAGRESTVGEERSTKSAKRSAACSAAATSRTLPARNRHNARLMAERGQAAWRDPIAGSPVYPLGSRVNERGHLEVGGCDVVELAAEFGTPAYVYAEDDMRARARAYRDGLRSSAPTTSR